MKKIVYLCFKKGRTIIWQQGNSGQWCEVAWDSLSSFQHGGLKKVRFTDEFKHQIYGSDRTVYVMRDTLETDQGEVSLHF